MDRANARACAMKLLYEWEMGGDGGDDTRFGMLEITPEDSQYGYINDIVDGVVKNIAEIDGFISKYAVDWRIDRISRVDLSIMRLGCYELKLHDVPTPVILSEAISLAKQYSTDKAASFISGVLGNISRNEYQ